MVAWGYKVSHRVLENIFSSWENKFPTSKQPGNSLFIDLPEKKYIS